jgi:uncharacterized membrane protein YdjX (TVP38/TMEM64 family)
MWIQELSLVGRTAAFSTLYVVLTVAGFPVMVLSLAAGVLFGFVGGAVLVGVVAGAGASVAFELGRALLQSFAASLVKKWPQFNDIDRAVASAGFKIVLLLRLSPLTPYNIMNYAMAVTSVSSFDYHAGSFLGMLPLNTFLVFLGSQATDLSSAVASDQDKGSSADGAHEASQSSVSMYLAIIVTLASLVVINKIIQQELNAALKKPSNKAEK